MIVIIAIAAVVVGFAGLVTFRARAGKGSSAQSVGGALSKMSQAGFREAETALKAGKFEVKSSIKFNADCAGKSEGELREYFLSNPCEGLARAYIQIGDARRNLILVAISWVEMSSVASGEEYGRLVVVDVGNIVELSREVPTLKNITYEDRLYASGVKGAFVWQVEVKPVTAKVPDAVVNDVLERTRQ
ncbi:hypothetical protein [Actinomadura spongiicola]|uniref:hypothetical protein n=1 Tax=Actinomadura spongiicola TaxID=2303421 RepID=UPI0011C13771|nr:hypothetical protein [Actinomadura spongiicola]